MRVWRNKAWGVLMHPGSMLYGAAVASRNRRYDVGRLEVIRLPVPVISVGNLTVGGTGKSPLVDFLARRLMEEGRRVGIVSRGYGRRTQGVVVVSDGRSILVPARDAGDEPMLLARRNPGAVIVVGEDRAAAGQAAVELGCDLLVLDDGFQHRRLARDLDLVVVDATNPWGNGRLLPGGPLREPLSSMNRADAVVLTRTDESASTDDVEDVIREYTDTPVFRTRHHPSSWTDLGGGRRLSVDDWTRKRVAAFSGIGHPEAFERTLVALGLDVAVHLRFRDHCWYALKDLDRINQRAVEMKVSTVVTTEKDAVRLPVAWRGEMPTLALGIDLDFPDGSGAFETFVKTELAKHSEAVDG